MPARKSSNRNRGCFINLLALAGSLFILNGALIAYPLIRDQLSPPPASFGEAQPPVLPTVTPLPVASLANTPTPAADLAVTVTPEVDPDAITATPDLLPETPLEEPQQSRPPIAATPVITNPIERIPTRLVISAINLDAPIEPVGWTVVRGVSVWDIPQHFAAGWLKTSAPLGTVGNTVLDGHHNTAGEVFRDLVDLQAGDLIHVYADEQRFDYEVTGLHILPEKGQPLKVRRQNAVWIAPTTDERLTLVTCWPYSTNTHRLIVVAKPIG